MTLRRASRVVRRGQEPPPRPNPNDPAYADEGEEGERSPLGVPSGYTAPVPRTGPYSARGGEVWAAAGRGVGTIQQRAPIYFTGDEFKPSNMHPSAIVQLQQDLVRIGLLNPDEVIGLGSWDEATRAAYKKLLEYANARGLDATNAIAERRAFASSATRDVYYDENGTLRDADGNVFGSGVSGLTIQQPDTETVRQALRTMSVELLGEGLPSEDIDSLTTQYVMMSLDRQRRAAVADVGQQMSLYGSPQEAADNAEVVTEIPSVGEFGETAIREQFPEKVSANRGAALLTSLINQWS